MSGRTPREKIGSLPRTARALLVAALALALLACSEDVGTSVRVSLVYKDSWRMGSAEVVLTRQDAVLERSAPIAHELLVLLPDRLAGAVMPLDVWGVRDGERISHGSAVALVRAGETVEATVVLDRLPCGVFCTLDAGDCLDGGLRTCVEDADGCLQWSEPMACPAATPNCSGGECRDGCIDECVAGQGLCVDANSARACGQFDSDSCLDYGAQTTCGNGQVCYSGRCAAPCAQGALGNAAVPGTATAFAAGLASDAGSGSHAVFSATTSRALLYGYRRAGGSWPAVWETIPGAVGESPSVAVDRLGGVHVFAGGVGALYAYRPPAGTWQVTQVRAGPNRVATSAIAVAGDGSVHAVFYDVTAQVLRHATKGAPWIVEDIGAGMGVGCDLAVTGTTLHVSSLGTGNSLWYSSLQRGAAWVNTELTHPFGSVLYPAAGTAIAADRSGTLHLAYSDLIDSGSGTAADDLRYVYKAGSSWTAATVIDNRNSETGGSPDLAVDPFDRLHVAYRTTSAAPALQYASKDAGSGTWVTAAQPPVTSGARPVISAAPNGEVRILSTGAASLVETARSCQ